MYLNNYTTNFQLAIKLYSLLGHRQNYAKFLNMLQRFWNAEDIAPKTDKVHQEIAEITKLNEMCNIALFLSGIAYVVGCAVLPVLSQERHLPFEVYIPPGCQIVLYITEMSTMTSLLFIVCSHDCLLSTICASLCIQFKLLAYKINHFDAYGKRDEEAVKETLKECVDHHIFILE